MNITKVKCDEIAPLADDWSEPVTTQSVYDHCNLNCGLESIEEQLKGFITKARRFFESDTDGRICLPTSFRQTMREWPCSNDVIRLERGRVTEITSISYYDANDELQELEDYESELIGIPALVYVPGNNYPALSTRKLRPITIEFIAGWADADSIPEDVKQDIRCVAATLYRNRENDSTDNLKEVAFGHERLCARYRTGIAGL